MFNSLNLHVRLILYRQPPGCIISVEFARPGTPLEAVAGREKHGEVTSYLATLPRAAKSVHTKGDVPRRSFLPGSKAAGGKLTLRELHTPNAEVPTMSAATERPRRLCPT